MMRMTVLASGSKGNSTVIASTRTRVLVDAGLSCRELLRRMAAAEEDPSLLDAILITHEHQDHVVGLATLARRLRIPVFLTEPTHRAWVRMMTPRTTMSYAQWLDRLERAKSLKHASGNSAVVGGHQRADTISLGTNGVDGGPGPELTLDSKSNDSEEDGLPGASCDEAGDLDDGAIRVPAKANPTYLPAVEYFHAGRDFSIGDISITPFTIPHDAADPCGFVFEAGGVRMALATDLGYMPPNVKLALKRADVLLLESNHDLEMLKDGPYPWPVKQRVLSRVGHLSNDATAEFLRRDYDGGAAYIVLGHLSEANNVPELARIAAEEAIGDRMTLLGNRVLLAQQGTPLGAICL